MAADLLAANEEACIETAWYEADHYFYKDGVYTWDGMQIGNAHAWCQEMVYEHLKMGKHVIVSNTFTLKRELLPYFDMIQEYGKNPTVILMQSNWGSTHGVPDGVLLNMKKRFCFDISDMFL